MIDTTKFGSLDVVIGTATSTAAAATVGAQSGLITTEALSTAAAASYTFTLTNPYINVNSMIFATVGKGTSTTGGLTLSFATAAAGSAVLIFTNPTATPLNGTVKIGFRVENLS